MEDNQNQLSAQGFFHMQNVEVIEHVFSFCSGKDLLRLTETCKTFKEIATTSPKLMKKLTLVVDLREFKFEDFGVMKKCIESRKFQSARLDILENIQTEFHINSRGSKFIGDVFFSMAQELEGIEDLSINGPTFDDMSSTSESFFWLISCLLPKVKTCKMCCPELTLEDYRLLELEPFQCNILTDLSFNLVETKFISCLLLGSPSLKRLAIAQQNSFNSKDFIIKGTSVWQLVSFKLEKLEILWCDVIFDETFNEFLTNQADLKEVTLKSQRFDYFSLLKLNPNIRKLNLLGHDLMWTTMSSIPHHQLHKVRLLAAETKMSSHCRYEIEAPANMAAFEKDFLAFLDSDTATPGLKHSQVILSLKLGTSSWIEAGAVLSKEFIEQLIIKLQKMKRLELHTASLKEDVLQIFKEDVMQKIMEDFVQIINENVKDNGDILRKLIADHHKNGFQLLRISGINGTIEEVGDGSDRKWYLYSRVLSLNN